MTYKVAGRTWSALRSHRAWLSLKEKRERKLKDNMEIQSRHMTLFSGD